MNLGEIERELQETGLSPRGAFHPVPGDDVPPLAPASPCASCADRPCLSACPVGAFDRKAYDVCACARHLAALPEPRCMEIACLSRHACSIGRDYRYAPVQARFHMRAFLKNNRSDIRA